MFSRFSLALALTLFAASAFAADIQNPIHRLLLQRDADGGGNSFTNLNAVQSTGTVYAAHYAGAGTNDFAQAGQTPWLTNIDGAGFNLTNVRILKATNFVLMGNANGNGKAITNLNSLIATNSITVSNGANGYAFISSSGRFFTSGQGSASDQFIAGSESHFISGGSGGDAIVGGGFNAITNSDSPLAENFLGGGLVNSILSGSCDVLLGGQRLRMLTNLGSAIVAGQYNLILGTGSSSSSGNTIIGGYSNVISGTITNSVILGGANNSVTNADGSLVAGNSARAAHDNVFIWSDGSSSGMTSSSSGQFLIRAENGVAINTNSAGTNALQAFGNIDALSFSIRGQTIGVGSGSNSVVQGLYNYPLSTVPPAGSLIWYLQFAFVGDNIRIPLTVSAPSVGVNFVVPINGWVSTNPAVLEKHEFYVFNTGNTNIPITFGSSSSQQWIWMSEHGQLAAPTDLAISNLLIVTIRHRGSNTNIWASYSFVTNAVADY